jgi:hypothetical protein
MPFEQGKKEIAVRRPNTTLSTAALALIAGVFLLAAAPPANAGCGCDHPPPDWSLVMPPFGSPGKPIVLNANGFVFVPGASYKLTITDLGGTKHLQTVKTWSPASLSFLAPEGLKPGPATIRVTGNGLDYTYPSQLFTLLAPAPLVPAAEGVYVASSFQGAVTADGTLLIPFNLTQVLDATQFAYQLTNLPLTFTPEDVVFFNSDGVDLTLFTLSVASEVEHQWGSYYGWTVEEDTRISDRVFQKKVAVPSALGSLSDVLHYWRHEFHTYYEAHLMGGTHEVNATGFHPDGTFHIDHDHLVLALHGLKRDSKQPLNTKKFTPLAPGTRTFDLALAVKKGANPIEPSVMMQVIETGARSPLVPEGGNAYGTLDPLYQQTSSELLTE